MIVFLFLMLVMFYTLVEMRRVAEKRNNARYIQSVVLIEVTKSWTRKREKMGFNGKPKERWNQRSERFFRRSGKRTMPISLDLNGIKGQWTKQQLCIIQ